MPEAKLTARLLSMTDQPLKVIYSACRQCYSSKYAAEIFEEDIPEEKMVEFVQKVVASGHESPLEHVSFTFAIEGISRVCSHQLVRHRIASYSQQSQRYVKEDQFDYIIPPSIKEVPELRGLFEDTMIKIQQAYNEVLAYFKAQGKKGEEVNQDARFLLPGACETKIVVTMNCRELLHFFRVRLCERAQWELRQLANEMLRICREKLPAVFEKAGAKCEWLGYCPEGKFSCGRYPLKEEVLGPTS